MRRRSRQPWPWRGLRRRPVPADCCPVHRRPRGRGRRVPATTRPAQPRLAPGPGSPPALLDLEYLDLLILFDLVLVDPDHPLGPGIDAGLGARGGFLDAQLGDTVVDR